VLVVDETGFLKKGNNSVGVKRQYSGAASRSPRNLHITWFSAQSARISKNSCKWPGDVGRLRRVS